MKDLDLIRQVEIFQGLSEKELAAIVRRGKQMEYKPNGVIVKEKTPGGMMHLILEGSVEVRKHLNEKEDKPLAILPEGSVFGEMSLFDGQPYSASVIARENTSTLTLFRTDILDLGEAEPALLLKVTINLINVMALRLRKTNENLITFAALRNSSNNENSGTV